MAVARALGPAAGIVWPNDLVMDGAKVCGVLCETAVDEAGTDWVVVGIGVNVRGAPEVTDGRWRAGCLADSGEGRSRGTLLAAILTELSVAYREWRDAGPEPALAEFAGRDLLRGEAVRVRSFDRELVGTANGLDDRGRLRVRTAGGEVAVDSGEVTKAG
ncbi:MAG: biotin--[acetyl-CoA-carboxylase] ligase [Thermoleophilia bacterium]